MSRAECGSQLGISRVRKVNDDSTRQVYFKIRPQQNEILDILQRLERYELHVTEVEHEITSKLMLQFPEVMKNLQLIIEFSDCIL